MVSICTEPEQRIYIKYKERFGQKTKHMTGQQVHGEKKRVKTEIIRDAHRAKVLSGKFPVGADNVDARLVKDVRTWLPIHDPFSTVTTLGQSSKLMLLKSGLGTRSHQGGPW